MQESVRGASAENLVISSGNLINLVRIKKGAQFDFFKLFSDKAT